MTYEKSPIDDFFYNLYGFYPDKAGQSYELLVNAALKIINKDSDVKYNQFREGTYSQQKYQLDGIKDEKESIEAKDYTLRNEKVGRPDVQKQEGGLIDLPFEGGVFASATGYTRNAVKYAKGTYNNPNGKPIDIYDIRPSTEEDEEGRVKTIIVNIHSIYLDFNNWTVTPIFTKVSREKLIEQFGENRIPIRMESIYNSDKSVFITLKDWTNSLNSLISLEDKKDVLIGESDFSNKYILIQDSLYEISKMKYNIPIKKDLQELRIEQDGNACLLVKNSDGTTNTLLTDVQLKNIKFDDGNVLNNGGTK